MSRIAGVAFLPDGTLLATIGRPPFSQAFVRGVEQTSAPLREIDEADVITMAGSTEYVDVGFSADGKFLATVSHRAAACLYNVGSGVVTP